MLLACCFSEPKKRKSKENRRLKHNLEDSSILIPTPYKRGKTATNRVQTASQKNDPTPTHKKDHSFSESHWPSFKIVVLESENNTSKVKKRRIDTNSNSIERVSKSKSQVSCGKMFTNKNVSHLPISKVKQENKKSKYSLPSKSSTLTQGKLNFSGERDNQVVEKTKYPNQILNYKEDTSKLIESIKEEYEKKIAELKEQYRIGIENEKKMSLLRLLEEKEIHRKELENVTNNAEVAVNQNISQLNKQMELERAKIVLEQEANRKNLEEEYRKKEHCLNNSLVQFEESLTLLEKREQEWQVEKLEVLKELQKLRAEANTLVTILSTEYEEDSMSEDKKRSLIQEVCKLKLLLEKKIKEKKMTKKKLKKAKAKLENLEQKLNMENVVEKHVSAQKRNSSKEMHENSNLEEIGNKSDLPVDNLNTKSSQRINSLPKTYSTQRDAKVPTTSPGYLTKSKARPKKNIKISDIGNSISIVKAMVNESTSSLTMINRPDDGDDAEEDADSLDEGLGTETPNSPRFPLNKDREPKIRMKINENNTFKF